MKLGKFTLCEGKRISIKAHYTNEGFSIRSFWSEIARNKFAFYDKTNISATIICKDKKFKIQLPTRGLLVLEQGCELVSDSVAISEYRSWQSAHTLLNPTFSLKEIIDERLIARLRHDYDKHSDRTHISLANHTQETMKMKELFNDRHDALKKQLNNTSAELHDKIKISATIIN